MKWSAWIAPASTAAMDKWIVSIGEHSQRSAVTARPPVPRGARQQQRFVWALGDAPGTAPTTAGDSGKRAAVGNVFMGTPGNVPVP